MPWILQNLVVLFISLKPKWYTFFLHITNEAIVKTRSKSFALLSTPTPFVSSDTVVWRDW